MKRIFLMISKKKNFDFEKKKLRPTKIAKRMHFGVNSSVVERLTADQQVFGSNPNLPCRSWTEGLDERFCSPCDLMKTKIYFIDSASGN